MLTRWGWTVPGFADELSRLSREVDRTLSSTRASAGTTAYPRLNLFEDGDNLVVTAEIPGISTDSIEVQVTLNTLTITGDRADSGVPEGAVFHRRERTNGSFTRKVTLPFEVDSKQVKASYTNGVIEVVLPRAEASKPRRIEITA